MVIGASATQCFLVEWYQTGPAALTAEEAAEQLSRAAAASGDGPVLLIMALTVPADQTLFGVFSAASADAVIDTCQRAGWPADRISTDVHPWLTPESGDRSSASASHPREIPLSVLPADS
jgi:hypothetical protein